ncbi:MULTISPECIES: RNA methyltransferase [unclassified Cellulophaga]|uniref:TrmH family RNA methyltransferase n=1 Tax=unclassified Cellulophaga TaxID=2634405 RepID=UPI001C4EC369|nr:RNA methyltransferase [Cellulophaga sp. HaHa_2_1]QXP53507.1 RNA methyltransferase [Cellulophaga sp. HaHa_2_1]
MIDLKLLNYLEEFISEERKERFLQILEERTYKITVAIEDVFQMHNTSAVVRSCDIFGIQSAHLIERKYGDQLDVQIAMGAQKWVDIHRYESTSMCIDTLKKEGYKIIATTPHNDSCLLDDFEFDGKIALFFGTEKKGLSDEVLEKADGFLKIPMVGFTESLNISVSAAIILQSLTTKLKKERNDWQLSDDEKILKQIDWAKKSIKSIDGVLSRYSEDT